MSKIFPIKTQTSCVFKWAWSTIYLNLGTTASCHRTKQFEINPDTILDFHNLPDKLAERRRMRQGLWPENNCGYCKDIENAGGMSDRMYQNRRDDITPLELYQDIDQDIVTPTILEIYFNNTCNMSCLYCGSHFSSVWEQETKKFGEFSSGTTMMIPPIQWSQQRFGSAERYPAMLEKFWQWLHNHYQNIRHYQILGGEPFYQPEFEQSLDFWSQHPNPNLTINLVTNLKVPENKFRTYIDKMTDMANAGTIKAVQISASLDCWGPVAEHVRTGLDLKQWQSNFEYLLDREHVVVCINSAIANLTIKAMPELMRRIRDYNKHLPQSRQIHHAFQTAEGPEWMRPDIFGAGVFDNDFQEIISIIESQHNRDHMQGIALQVQNTPRDCKKIQDLKIFLTEMDRRRGTDWQSIFPWLANFPSTTDIISKAE